MTREAGGTPGRNEVRSVAVRSAPLLNAGAHLLERIPLWTMSTRIYVASLAHVTVRPLLDCGRGIAQFRPATEVKCFGILSISSGSGREKYAAPLQRAKFRTRECALNRVGSWRFLDLFIRLVIGISYWDKSRRFSILWLFMKAMSRMNVNVLRNLYLC